MVHDILQMLAAQSHTEFLKTLILLMLLETQQRERLLTFRFECRCGRTFYIAALSSNPSVVGIGETPEEAKSRLRSRLDDSEIPDYLPEDI